MSYRIKKLHFNTFEDKIILQTEILKGNLKFDSLIEMPMNSLNQMINGFQRCFNLSFYNFILSEDISEEVYYTGHFDDCNWIVSYDDLNDLKLLTPRKICA